MNFFQLFLLAVSLSMDAFAASICKGLSLKRVTFKNTSTVGLYFGLFQGIMPLLGYLLAFKFADKIVAFDHWIAFVLLGIIGGKMIKDSFEQDDDSCISADDDSLSFKNMFPIAVATSIDALAVGVSLAFLNVKIIPAVLLIGVTTFLFSTVGVKIGNTFGTKLKSKAELFGGVILVLIGVKILFEHLKIISS